MYQTLAQLGTSLATVVGLSAAAPAAPVETLGGRTALLPRMSIEHATPAATAQSLEAQVPSVRLWLEEETDLFYPGDPVGLRFRTARDAYVALVHLDTEGNLELLFPGSPWRDELVRGGRVHAAPGALGRLVLGRTPGIGYFYLIASPHPLDLRVFRARSGGSDTWGLGRVVRGDPFWALEELTHLLVRDAHFAAYAVDVFSYHVGGRHRYPGFACYQGLSRLDPRVQHAYYPSCDRVQRLLAGHPHYYDTRRFRGDRGSYLRELDDLAPRHGFKEPIGRTGPPLRGADLRGGLERSGTRGQGIAAPPPLAVPEQEGGRAQPAPATPARQRPTLERRPPRQEPERERPAPARDERRENPPPRENAPQREQVRPERSDG